MEYKTHGVPGYGIVGKEGNNGEQGNSVYFGFINDFFDCVSVDINNFLYAARRINPIGSATEYGLAFNYDYYTGVVNTTNDVDPNNWIEGQLSSITTLNNIPNIDTTYEVDFDEKLNIHRPSTKIIIDMSNIPKNVGDGRTPVNPDDKNATGGFEIFRDVYYVDTKNGANKFQNWTLNTANRKTKTDYVTSNDILSSDVNKYKLWFKPGFKRIATNKDKQDNGVVIDNQGYTIEVVDTNDPSSLSPTNIRYYNIQEANMASLRAAVANVSAKYAAVDSTPNAYLKNAANGNTDALMYTHWKASDNNYIQIPQTLKYNIKEGDILYIYTDESMFAYNQRITGMIIITSDMLGASYDYIINKIVNINPFQFNDFDVEGNRITIDTGVNIGTFNLISAEIKKNIQFLAGTPISQDTSVTHSNEIEKLYKEPFTKNYNEFISRDNDYSLIVSNFTTENESDLASFIALDYDDIDKDLVYDNKLEIYRTTEVSGIRNIPGLLTRKTLKNKALLNLPDDIFNIKTDAVLKMNTPLLRHDVNTNAEVTGVINPVQYNLDSDGYAYSFTEDDFDTVNLAFVATDEKFIITNPNNSTLCIGAYVIDNNTNKTYNIERTEKNIKLPIKNDGFYDYTVIAYVGMDNNIKHFGHSTQIKFEIDNRRLKRDGYSITATTQAIQLSENNEDVKFSVAGLTAEGTNSARLQISTDYIIEGVYFNKVDMLTQTSAVKNYVWCNCNLISKSSSSVILGFDISNNIPQNVTNGTNFASVDELVNAYTNQQTSNGPSDLFVYDQIGMLGNTKSRTELITVKYKKDNSSESQFAYYNLTQPGFEDSRVIPNIKLVPLTDPVTLEACNSDELGVLGNQFQYFIDIEINDFNNKTWGKFKDTYKMDIVIKSLNDNYETIENCQKRSAKKLATATMILDKDPTTEYMDIDVDVLDADFDPKQTQVSDYKKHKLNSIYNPTIEYNYWDPTQATAGKLTSDIVEKTISGKKHIALSKIKDLLPNDTTNKSNTYSGIIKDYSIKISNISLGDNKLRLRVSVEMSDPLPACFNFNWYVDEIVIKDDEGHNFTAKDIIYTNFEVYPGIMHDIVEIAQGVTIPKPKYQTGNTQFFINPISMIAAPETEDDGLILNNAQIKITGSKDLVKCAIDMYGKEQVSNYTSNKDLHDISKRRNLELLNWLCWSLNVRDLQDNVRSIRIINKDPFNDTFPEDAFTQTISALPNGWHKFEKNPNNSEFEKNSFISIRYSASSMYAKNRDDEYTFYYNDDLLDGKRYSQQDNNTPVYCTFPVNAELRTDEMIKSMEVWNFEWEHCDYFNEIDNIAGAISKYGNGYNFLKDNADEGQYKTNESLPLAAVKNANKPALFETPYIDAITSFNGSPNAPENDKSFRTLLYDIGFEVPLFNDENNVYEMGSPYDALMKKKNTIPYTHCFNIYPRFAFNNQYKSTNVFMLRRPSIGKDGDYTFNNRLY